MVVGVIAVALATMLSVLAFVTRKSVPRAAGLATAIALASVVPLAIVVYERFARPIDSLGMPAPSYDVLEARVGIVPVLAVAAGAFAMHRGIDTLRRLLAWTCALACAAVFVFAAAHTEGRRDREEVPRALPVVAVLAEGAKPLRLGAITVELRRERGTGCRVHVSGDYAMDAFVPASTGSYCPPTRVRNDAVDELIVVEVLPPWNAPLLADDSAWEVMAVRSTRDGRPSMLDAASMRASLRVPVEWSAAAACAGAFAFAWLFVAQRMRLRARALAALVDAKHEGEGWFVLDGGQRVRVPLATALAMGPFAVRVEGRGEEAYRSSAATTIDPICAGTVADNVDRVRDFAGSCEGIALAAVAIGASPAAVAAYVLFA